MKSNTAQAATAVQPTTTNDQCNGHSVYKPGLEGVVAAETALSHVDGQKGELLIGGYRLEELAANATFEEVVYLLWHGSLPQQSALETFEKSLATQRALPPAVVQLLRAAAKEQIPTMTALRMAAGTIDIDSANTNDNSDPTAQAQVILARLPTIVATYWRLATGQEPFAPNPTLNHAANYLYMLTGQSPTSAQVRGLETYLNTVIDHGLNASTFAARVIIATATDLTSAVVGALGALKGPLHGGAPGPALDMVFDIGQPAHAESYLRAKLASGERLMGFGHRIYRVRDPRAEVLAQEAARMFQADGDMALYELAKTVEAKAVALLAEYKPGRNLQTNVEFYTALLLHGLGLETDLFTPTFAISRAAGWLAHCFEQQATGRLIRPQSHYIGERKGGWLPIEQRN
ncbi:MAG TPA: citrate synthase/methylcitrate synthase [Caldilineaceae bacterium]|nr:citrate synthase/methylcitrate synthase [Caldilineaceae bacterium]